MSILHFTVLPIVSISAEGKMAWITTPWVIARVHDMHSILNWPIGEHIGDAMSVFLFDGFVSKLSVAFSAAISNPRPAFISSIFVDSRPESLFKCTDSPYVHLDIFALTVSYV